MEAKLKLAKNSTIHSSPLVIRQAYLVVKKDGDSVISKADNVYIESRSLEREVATTGMRMYQASRKKNGAPSTNYALRQA
jgi:hypothetical protein